MVNNCKEAILIFSGHASAITVVGHAAMEAACCNLVEPGDIVLVGWNGTWGERFSDMAERNGIRQLLQLCAHA